MLDYEEFYRQLDMLYESSDVSKIEEYLKTKEMQLGQNDRKDRLTVQNEIMSLYRGTDRFEEAIRVAEIMKKEMLEIGFADTQQYAVVLLNEATTYQKMSESCKRRVGACV